MLIREWNSEDTTSGLPFSNFVAFFWSSILLNSELILNGIEQVISNQFYFIHFICVKDFC